MNIEDAGGSLRGSAIVCSIQRRELGAAAIMADNTQPKTQTAAAAAAAEQQPQSGVLGPDAVSATPTEVLAAAASAIATDDATGWAPATSHSGMDVAILASPTLNAPSLEPSGPYARYSASGRTPHSRPSRVTLSLVAPGADRYDVLAAEAACVYAVRMRRLRGRAPATAVRHSALTAPGAVPPGAAGANAGPGADAGISGRSASGAASGSSTIGAAWGRGAEHAAVPTSAAGPASSCYGGTSSGPFPELEISPRSDPAPALSGAQLAALSSLFQPHSCAARGGVTGGNDNGNVRGGDGSSRGPGLAPGHGGRRASQVATSSGAMPTLPEGVEVGTMRPQALGLQGEAAEGEEDEHCQAAHLQGQRQHAAASAAPAPQVLLPAQMAEGGGASSFATSLAVIAVDSCTRGFGPPSDGDALAAGPGSAALSDTFSAYAAGLSEALSLLPGPNSGGRDAAGRGSRRRRSMWVQRRSTGSCSGSGTAASSLQGLHEFSGEVEGPSGHLQAAAAAAGASSYSHSSSARRSAAGILHSVVAPGLPGRPALKRSSMPSASALALAATLGRALKEEADGDSTGDRRSSTGDGVVGFSRMVRQDSPVTPRAIQARGFQACEVVSAAAAATAGAMGAVAAAGGATAGVPGAGAAAAHCRVQQLLRPAAGSAEGTSGHSLSLSAIAPGPGGDRRSFDSATGSVVTAAGMCLRPSLDAGPAQRDDGAAVEAAIAAGAGTAAAIPAADEVADTNSYDSYDTEEDDTEPGGAVGKGGASGADAAGSQGFTKSAAGGIAGPKDAAAGGRGAAAAAASHAATAAVDRYGSLLVGSAGWRYTEMHDVHDTLLMSRLTSNSRWRGPQALGSVASGHNANRSEGGAEVHSTRGGSNSKWLSPAGPSAPLGAALGQPHHSYQQVNHTSRQRRPAAMVDSHASHEVDLGLVDLAPLSSAQHSPGLSPNPSITSYRLHQLLQPGVEMSPTGTAPTSANTDAIIALATGPGGGDAAAPAGPADAAAEAWAAWYRAVPSTRHTTSTQHYILEPPHTLSPRTSLGSGGMAPSPAATAALPTNTVPGAGSGARPNSDAGGTSPAPPASGIVVPAASRPAANQGRASLDSRLATPGHSHYRTAAGAGGPTGFSFGAWSQARPPPHHPRPTTGTWLGGGHVAGSNTWRPPAAGGGMVAAAAAGGRPGSGNRSRMAASTLGPGQAPAAVSVPQQPHQRQHDHTHGYPPPHPLHPDPQGQQGQHQLPTSASALNSAHGGGRAMALVSPVRGAPGFRVSRTSMASPTAARMSAGGSNHGHDYRPLGGEAPSGGVTGDSDVNLLMTTGEFMAGVAVSAEQEHPQLDEQQQPALQQAMGWAATLEVLREQVTCPSPPVPSPRVSVAGRSSRMLSAGFKLLAGGRSQRSFKGMHGAGDVGDGVTGYAPGSERTTPVPSPLVHAAARGQHRSSAGGGGPAGASRVLAVVTGAPPGSRSRAVSAAGAMPLAASSPVISSGSEAAAGTAPAAAPSPRAQPAAERPSRMRTSTHGAGAAPASPLPAASSSAEPSRTSLPAGVAAGGGGGAGAGSPRPSLFTRTLKALLPGPRSVPQSPRAQSLPSDEVGHAEDAEPGSDAAVDADPGMGRPFTLFQAPPLHAGATPAVAAAPHAPSLPHRPASRTLSRLALGRACSGAGDPNSTAEPPARPLHDSDTGGRDWTPGPAGQSVPPSAAHAGPAATHGGSIGGRSRGADSFTFGVPRPPPPPMGRWSMDDGWQRVRSPDAVMAVGDAAATAPPLAHRRLQRPYHFYSDGHVNLLSAHDASVPRGAVAVAPVDQPTAVMPAPTAALAMAAGRAVRLLPTLLCEVREEDSESAGDPASSRRGTDVGLLGDAVGSSSGAAGLAVDASTRALGAAGYSADGGGGGNGDSAAGDSGDGSAQHPQQPARSRLAKLFGLKRSASGGGAGSTGVVSTGSWTGLSGVGSMDEGLASAPASPSGGGRGGLVRALTRSRLASLAVGGGPGQPGRPDSQPSSAGDSAAAALAADSSAAATAGASLGAGQRSASGLKTFMHSLWSSKAATQRKSSKRAAAAAAAGLDAALGAGPSATHAPGVGGGAAVPGNTTDRSCHSASSAHSPLSALSEGKHSQGHAALAATSRLREAAWADLEPQALAPSLRSLTVATVAASASVPGSPVGSGAGQGSSSRRKLHKKLLRLGQRLTGGGGGSSSSGGDGGSGQGTGPEGSPRGGGRGAAIGTVATPMARRVKSLFMPPSHSHFAAPDAAPNAAPDATSNTTPSGYAAPAPAPASGYPHGSGMQVATASANAAAAHSTSHSRVRAQALAHAHAQAQAEAQARMNQLAPLAAALFTPGK